MTKDNVWKELKDSDVAVLWFLISVPKWEWGGGEEFFVSMTTAHFIKCLWAWSFLLSSGTLYLFSCNIRMLKYKEAQRAPVLSRALWNETTRVLGKIPAAELRMEPILPDLKKPVLLKSIFGFVFKLSKSKPMSPGMICPAKVCSDSLGVHFVEQPIAFVLKASDWESVFSNLDHLSCTSLHLPVVIRKFF